MYLNPTTGVTEVTPEDLPPVNVDHAEAIELWCAVLERAIEDLAYYRRGKVASSCDWFISNSIDEGSFIWVCRELSSKMYKFNPNEIRRKYYNDIYWQYV